jgi:type IX secretion system PorP/SprF family membrane protein
MNRLNNKKQIMLLLSLMITTAVFGQSRKYMSHFSQMQSYYNPALTGYEGSMIRGFVRNQWLGLEGAPKTAFFSTEFDFADFTGKKTDSGQNAMGLNILHDQYGPFVETESILSYSVRVKLNEKTNIRLGSGFNYNAIRLDGFNLTTELSNDPTIEKYLNKFSNMQIMDFNLGIAITNERYYASYGVHNVNGGLFKTGDIFINSRPSVHVGQLGFRDKLSDNLSVSTNAKMRLQKDLPVNFDLDMKVLLMNKLWIGGGHRFDYAYYFQTGFVFNKIKIGYIFETPQIGSYMLPNTTHEFLLTYALFSNYQGLIW